MVCFRPLKAYRAPGGGVVFDSRRGYADRPLELPCGQCAGCRVARAQQWSIRCIHEASLHARNCFVTLTYRPEKRVDEETGEVYGLPDDGSLNVRHWQLFAKRLRKSGQSFRYLHCGEYGGVNYRPHYHALLFGVDFHEDRTTWREQGSSVLYTSARLEALWGHGFVSIGALTRESAQYVARYTLKKVSGPLVKERYRRIDLATGEEYFVRPEYATMSRRPGLGAGWYEKFKGDVFPDDEVIHEGKRYGVPDFYFKRLESEDPDSHAVLKASRSTRMLEARAASLDDARKGSARSTRPDGVRSVVPRDARSLSDPERLAARETVFEARLGLRPRDEV